jgi:hypothetical protein
MPKESDEPGGRAHEGNAGSVSMPFTKALEKGMENLKDSPMLLYGLCGAILLIGVATLGVERARPITIPILALLIISLIGWLLLEAFKVSKNAPQAKTLNVEGIDIGEEAKVLKGAELKGGQITSDKDADHILVGGITLGKGSTFAGSATGSDVHLGGHEESKPAVPSTSESSDNSPESKEKVK